MYNVSVFNVCSKHSTFSFSFSQLYSQHEPDRTSRRSELTHLSGLLNAHWSLQRVQVTLCHCHGVLSNLSWRPGSLYARFI